MSPQRPRLAQPRFLAQAFWPVAMALGLTACVSPPELTPGSLTPGAIALSGKRPAPWEARVAARSDAERRLSEGEGEIVVANAVAAHEKRRP
jgi:hypothetical protein